MKKQLMLSIAIVFCILFASAQEKKVVLITGSAAGIGKATAELLLQEGYVVYGGDIQYEKNKYLNSIGGHALDMDITNITQVNEGVAQVIKEQGRIDVLVANAGFATHGPAELVTIEDAQEQLNVNLFGHARCVNAVLPHMRKQESGQIIFISSGAGIAQMPGMTWYPTSKHALEGYADGLRMEVRHFGINVTVIEPGFIVTDFQKNAQYTLDKAKEAELAEVYSEQLKAYEVKFDAAFKGGSHVSTISNAIKKAIEAKYPERRYQPNMDSKAAKFMDKWIGDGLLDDFSIGMSYTPKPNPFKRKTLSLYADAYSLFNEGYRIGATYNSGRTRIGLNYFDVMENNNSLDNDGIEHIRQGVNANIGMFISDEQRGLNFGLDFNYFTMAEVVEKATEETIDKDLYRAGFYVGYFWQPVKTLGLFIEPTISAGYAFGDEDITFQSGRMVESEGWDVSWPMINVGWKINL